MKQPEKKKKKKIEASFIDLKSNKTQNITEKISWLYIGLRAGKIQTTHLNIKYKTLGHTGPDKLLHPTVKYGRHCPR